MTATVNVNRIKNALRPWANNLEDVYIFILFVHIDTQAGSQQLKCRGNKLNRLNYNLSELKVLNLDSKQLQRF